MYDFTFINYADAKRCMCSMRQKLCPCIALPLVSPADFMTLLTLSSRNSMVHQSFGVLCKNASVALVRLFAIERSPLSDEVIVFLAMLYVLTKRVGDVLSLGSSLQGSSGFSLSSTRRDTDSQKHDNPPPEISLVATAIVVLKLVYGLDGKQRQGPLRASDQLTN